MSDTFKNILFVLVILGGAFLLYFLFFSGEKTPLLGSAEKSTEGEALTEDLFALLRDLEKIDLDTSMFESAAFHALKDPSIEIPPQPKGRVNPFAPL